MTPEDMLADIRQAATGGPDFTPATWPEPTPDPLREALKVCAVALRGIGEMSDATEQSSFREEAWAALEAVEAALAQPAPALDFITWELAARFWVHYRCEMVGCEIVEQHEHGGGQPMREMTLAERAAIEGEGDPA